MGWESGDELRYALATNHWPSCRSCNSATIGDRDDVLGKDLFESGEVSPLRRGEEGLKKAAMFGSAYLCPPLVGDVFACAGDQLAGIRFGEVKDIRDVAIGIIEGFAKIVSRAFIG